MTYWIGEHADLVTLSGEGRPYSAPEPDPLTPAQKSQAAIAAFLTLAAFGCALVTAALLLLTAFLTYRLHDILTTRPHTQAEVRSTEIYSQRIDTHAPHQTSHPTVTVYGFRCLVDYTVAGRPYESQADIGYQKGDRSDMVPWYNQIQPGEQIEIAYKPEDPTHIYFAGDFTTAYAPALLLVRWIAWLVAIGGLAALVARRLRPPTAAPQ